MAELPVNRRKPKVYDMEIAEPHFSNIRDGLKTVEGRKRSEKWIPIRVGDQLHILPKEPSNERSFYVEVVYINEYDGKDPLFAYLVCEGLNNALPGIETITEAIEVYLAFSKAAEIKKLGFFGFGLKLI
jgi:ASC-1-like (ASCH) protein